jgi:ribosomal protein L37E
MATVQPGIDPPTDEIIALLCADYLDHLNGSGGRTRAEIASIPLAPSPARRLRDELDRIDELHKLAAWAKKRLLPAATAYLGHRDHHRRTSGGRCQRCGYDLRGNATRICPECGTPIPPEQIPGRIER